MDFHISAYQPEQMADLIRLWNTTLGTWFPMSERLWRQNVDTEANYQPGDGIVAYTESGMLAGMALTREPSAPAARNQVPSAADLGWLLALAVAPPFQRRGLGRRLLTHAEDQLRGQGARRCDLGGGLGHFLPGPPLIGEDAAGSAHAFWQHHGYTPLREEYDLHRELAEFVAPPLPEPIRAGEYRFAVGRGGEEDALLAFLGRCFPGRWRYAVADTLARGGAMSDVLLLKDRAGTIQGFLSMWSYASATLGPSTNWYPLLGERFGGIGPLGIAPEVRGLHLGLALVAEGARVLQQRGVMECVIDWTTLVSFYERLGFRIWRRYLRYQPKDIA